EGKRLVAAHDDAVEVAGRERPLVLETRPTRAAREQAGEVARPQRDGRDVGEAVVERRTRDEVEPDCSGVRVRRAVRHEHERGSSGALDLELLVEAAVTGPERAGRDLHERDVSWP